MPDSFWSLGRSFRELWQCIVKPQHLPSSDFFQQGSFLGHPMLRASAELPEDLAKFSSHVRAQNLNRLFRRLSSVLEPPGPLQDIIDAVREGRERPHHTAANPAATGSFTRELEHPL